MKKLIPILALALCAGLIAAGCGDDDDETTTEATTEAATTGATGATGETGAEPGGGLLPDDFAADANAICEEANTKFEEGQAALFGQDGEEPSDADQEAYVNETMVPGLEDALGQFEDLGDPDEGADEWSTFLDEVESAKDEIADDPSLVIESQSSGDDPFADVSQQATALGIPACAE